MRRLPLSSLQAFEAAARTGSFRAAGEELGISPSAISHAIRKLEDLMGATLFDRQSRRVRLNPAGEALLAHVAAGFDQMRQGVETVGARSGNLLRLHCAPSMAAQWLLPRLRHLFLALEVFPFDHDSVFALGRQRDLSDDGCGGWLDDRLNDGHGYLTAGIRRFPSRRT